MKKVIGVFLALVIIFYESVQWSEDLTVSSVRPNAIRNISSIGWSTEKTLEDTGCVSEKIFGRNRSACKACAGTGENSISVAKPVAQTKEGRGLVSPSTCHLLCIGIFDHSGALLLLAVFGKYCSMENVQGFQRRAG